MWKESYRIGIPSIDEQHIQLFKMVDLLLHAITDGSDKETFWDTIDFLKKYVVFHFDAEEAYQRDIHYDGFEAHRKLHQDFTTTVLNYEKQLIETDCDMSVLKDLAGTLTAWLVYHVAGEDQKIVTGIPTPVKKAPVPCLDSFCFHTFDVLQKMTGIALSNVALNKQAAPDSTALSGDVFVEIGLVEGLVGTVVFGFSQGFAFELMHNMTFIIPEQADELVCSALAEISNIICGNTITELTGGKKRCSITPPTVRTTPFVPAPQMETATLVTPLGTLTISLKLG